MVVASVIGGAGRMGAWFATFLQRNGYRVVISDKNKSAARAFARMNGVSFAESNVRAIRSAALVILATPTAVTPAILEQIKEHISPSTLLVEISSVKEPLRKTLQSIHRQGIAILSIHPMFGPGAKSLSDKAIITLRLDDGNIGARKFLALLRKRGAKIIRCNFEDHDRLASMLLALPHFVNIAMLNTLRSMTADPNLLREVGGTTMKLQLLTAEAVCHEDSGNEISILMDSRFSLNVLAQFAKETKATLDMIKRRKRESLARSLRTCRDFAQQDKLFANAYTRFNAAVEASSLH